MITSYFQKTTKASREGELHGHARKLCDRFLRTGYDNELRITDEGLSISRKISRVSGKPFSIELRNRPVFDVNRVFLTIFFSIL